MFSKPLRNVVAADVELVCSSRLPEGPEVEYKEALPTKSGTDPWVNGGDHIGERARKKVLEEIVAFANAFGGTLVIGIAETAEKPARANNIKPIPRCVELAERLSLQCRDCIDPKIPLIEIAGVPTQNDGAGIVIIRTPRSRMAPHRHAITRECYIRRADRSEKMTMREIQDLTLNVERGLAAIESRFDERKRLYANFLSTYGNSSRTFGMRASLQPMSSLFIRDVHKNFDVLPEVYSFPATLNSENAIELSFNFLGSDWRPALRGSRCRTESGNSIAQLEVHCDGFIEYQFVMAEPAESRARFYRSWFMAVACSAMVTGEKFRQAAQTPVVEYALEIALSSLGGSTPVGMYGRGHDFGQRLGPLAEGNWYFPRYSVASPNEFQQLASEIERDFWNLCGHEWNNTIAVDFSDVLPTSGT